MSDTRRRYVIASANPEKVAEIMDILQATLGDEFDLLARPNDVADVEETGATLLDNARLKAVALMEATGSAAIADDTGLFVTALSGAPGVYSARYSGDDATYEENVAKLLTELGDRSDRSAEFRTVAVATYPDRSEVIAEGAVRGAIAFQPWGSFGFGYDPVFIPEEGDGRSFAEMDSIEKHELSHRGRAFRALARQLVTS